MLFLTQHFTKNNQRFIEDAHASGVDVMGLSREVGEVTEHLTNVYHVISEGFTRPFQSSSPLDLLQVPVPDFWEIRITNIQGEIWSGGIQRGIVVLRETGFRKVDFVEWWSLDGKPLSRDYYNAYGWRYAQEIFDASGKVTYRYHYNARQEICVLDDYTVDRIIIFRDDLPCNIPQDEFFPWFLREYINEDIPLILGDPNLFSTSPPRSGLKGVWTGSEALSGEQVNHWLKQVETLYIQDYSVYLQSAEKERVHHLGPLYANNERPFSPHALILTASEEVEKLNVLVKALPQIHFHIAAHTNMGQKLTQLECFENVSLYPAMEETDYNQLLETCSIYLDINHHMEVSDGTQVALDQGLLILAFKETCHHPDLLSPHLLWESASVDDMIALLDQFKSQPLHFQEMLKQQYAWIQVSSPEDYLALEHQEEKL